METCIGDNSAEIESEKREREKKARKERDRERERERERETRIARGSALRTPHWAVSPRWAIRPRRAVRPSKYGHFYFVTYFRACDTRYAAERFWNGPQAHLGTAHFEIY